LTSRTLLLNQRIKELDILRYECTEIGLGRLFTDLYGSEIRYEPEENKFFTFSYKAGIWKTCTQAAIERMVLKFLSKDCHKMIRRITDETKKQNYERWIDHQQTNGAIYGIIKSVKRQKGIETLKRQFGLNPKLFALKNGVLNLETMEVEQGRREDLITKQANVYYDDGVTDSTWSNFLRSISGESEEMYEYLLRKIAYTMQGNSIEHCLFLLYGKRTRNGKSTYVNGLAFFFGDYSTTLQPQSLSKNRVCRAGNANPDILKLKGARFVNIAEADHNLKLDAAIIKTLTGQDRVSARGLYKDYEEFINQAVFYMHVNRLPQVDDATLFSSNRVIVIPFDQYFGDQTADRSLPEKLIQRKALSGLLNEIIRVMKKYKGIPIKANLPKPVIRETENYEKNCDYIGWFLKHRLIKHTGAWTRMKFIYDEYVPFAELCGHEPLASGYFTKELHARGYETREHGVGNGLMGYKIKSKI